MNNEDTFLDFSRISRSNTSPHIAKGESGWFKADNDSIPEGGEVAGRGEYGGGWDGTISLAQKPATDSRRRKKHNIGIVNFYIKGFNYFEFKSRSLKSEVCN